MAMQDYGNGIYVAITTDGHITTSIDGITWGPIITEYGTQVSIGVTPFTSIDAYWSYNGILFGNGYFVAYGNHIVIVGTGLPGSAWLSTLVKGGNWISATFNADVPNKWFLTDSEGRTATSRDSYPADWTLTKPTRFLPPGFEFDPMSNW